MCITFTIIPSVYFTTSHTKNVQNIESDKYFSFSLLFSLLLAVILRALAVTSRGAASVPRGTQCIIENAVWRLAAFWQWSFLLE